MRDPHVVVALQTAARQTVLRHPQSLACEVWRRTARDDASGNEAADYTSLGIGRVLFTSLHEIPAMADGAEGAQTRAMAMVESTTRGAFAAQAADLVMVLPGAGLAIPYEVTDVVGTMDAPPYMQRCELMVDLDVMEQR